MILQTIKFEFSMEISVFFDQIHTSRVLRVKIWMQETILNNLKINPQHKLF